MASLFSPLDHKLKGSFVLTVLFLLFFSFDASAKLFRNAYVSFELPESWTCTLEGTEWVCSSSRKEDSKESIIILTAKEVGPQDSLAAYETYLKAPRPLKQIAKSGMSQVKNIRTRKINDHPWVDALHLGSEIPGYYTRYIATVKDKIAILVTLSAHQKYYTKYSNDYFKAVESLRVIASKDMFTPKALAPVKPGSNESLGAGLSTGLNGDSDASAPSENMGGGPSPVLLGGAGVLMAIAGYLFWKKKS